MLVSELVAAVAAQNCPVGPEDLAVPEAILAIFRAKVPRRNIITTATMRKHEGVPATLNVSLKIQQSNQHYWWIDVTVAALAGQELKLKVRVSGWTRESSYGEDANLLNSSDADLELPYLPSHPVEHLANEAVKQIQKMHLRALMCLGVDGDVAQRLAAQEWNEP